MYTFKFQCVHFQMNSLLRFLIRILVSVPTQNKDFQLSCLENLQPTYWLFKHDYIAFLSDPGFEFQFVLSNDSSIREATALSCTGDVN